MIDYGAPPEGDEFEVTLFGPGYGEALALHLGEGTWMLVDSCIAPDTDQPASREYLQQLGVIPEQVKVIVATHWHDDHIRGISDLARTYPEAEFAVSGVFNNKEAIAFLAGYGGTGSSGLARGARELYDVMQERKVLYPALHRSIVLEKQLNGNAVRVTAFSPVPAAFAQCVAHMAQYIPREDDAITHAPELKPNLEAVVLHVDLAGDALLLGADLEDHGALGWTAIAADQWSAGKTRATVYKAAHHGSHTGDCLQTWEKLLANKPLATVTPFNLGSVRLPTDADKARLKANTAQTYISSGASRRPRMDKRIEKRVGDIVKNLVVANAGFGAVRLRRKIGAPTWSVSLFGAAQAI